MTFIDLNFLQSMIGVRGARTGEPVDIGDAGAGELVDVEDEGVSDEQQGEM